MSGLVFLKLGGSLLTEKDKPHTPRPEVIARAADEIALALQAEPKLRLVLGHGSGSFAHVPAARWNTRQGVRSPVAWGGFLDVVREAAELDGLVLAELRRAGVRALPFPPSAAILASRGQPLTWDTTPIRAALNAGLVPVVYGDAVLDLEWGGTILSTEELFNYLARELRPDRLLLAGIESGVWADFPARTRLLRAITPFNAGEVYPALQGSAATDVTGGMESKVRSMLDLVGEVPGLVVSIFSGAEPGVLQKALSGDLPGTTIHK